MAEVLSCERVGLTHVRLRTSNNAGVLIAGELVGWGPRGAVLRDGPNYVVRDGTGRNVACMKEPEWQRRKWEYLPDYFGR